jgi:hypothetical protein
MDPMTTHGPNDATKDRSKVEETSLLAIEVVILR